MNLIQKNIEISSMDENSINNVCDFQKFLLGYPQVSLDTNHVLHGGMYARTLTIPQGTVVGGALVKVPTILIVQGNCRFYDGNSTIELFGYNVIPASAHRKQIVYACENVMVTMIFSTNATTVEEAEIEFTDEVSSLMSNNNLANNEFFITGESK